MGHGSLSGVRCGYAAPSAAAKPGTCSQELKGCTLCCRFLASVCFHCKLEGLAALWIVLGTQGVSSCDLEPRGIFFVVTWLASASRVPQPRAKHCLKIYVRSTAARHSPQRRPVAWAASGHKKSLYPEALESLECMLPARPLNSRQYRQVPADCTYFHQ